MLFMMEWKVNDGCMEAGVKKFLSTQAPLPEGAKQVFRYHAPGSQKGWLVIETDDFGHVYSHASEWAHLLTWKVTPVVDDANAGKESAKVWGGVKLGCGW